MIKTFLVYINFFLLTLPKFLLSLKIDKSNFINITEPYYEDGIKGPALRQGNFDYEKTRYFKNYDFFNMENNENLTIFKNFYTYQQTADFTDGCASIIMALYRLGKTNISERECSKIAELDPSPIDGSITILPENLIKTIRYYKYDVISYFENEALLSKVDDISKFVDYIKDSINKNEPIIILSNLLGGHYQIIVGIDEVKGPLGQEQDILILADSYDIYDNYQDGFSTINIGYFFTIWMSNVKGVEQGFQFFRVTNLQQNEIDDDLIFVIVFVSVVFCIFIFVVIFGLVYNFRHRKDTEEQNEEFIKESRIVI